MIRYSTIIMYTCAGIMLLFLFILLGMMVQGIWENYQLEKKTEQFQLALSKPYREDTYGGKTPEETWSLFLDALRKGDLELASKYIVPEKREEKLEFLKKEEQIDSLKLLLFQMSGQLQKENSSSSDSETGYYMVPFKNTEGQMEANPIVFILNPYTKIWKISLL